MLMLICLFVGGVSAFAQSHEVSGVVISADDGEPVIGASVVVTGTTIGTITKLDGDFELVNVPRTATTLTVSFLGMKTKEVPITQGTIKVTLESEAELMDELVVTAMGITRSQKTLGYAATTVKSDELVGSRTTNVVNALQGKVAGVQVNALSTDPGSASNVVIRGFSSINGGNQPLYVVDGVPLETNTLTGGGKSVAIGGIGNIAADDIESLTVLKGAAATALYGSRAANGVIVITTKKGQKGAERNFTVRYSGGVQARQLSGLPEFQNEYGQGWDGGQTFIENGSWGPKLDGSLQVYGPIWNNQQKIHQYSALKSNVKDFFEIGWSHNHDVSISGASDDGKMDYYLSYSYTSDDGIMPSDYDTYQRNTIAFRANYEPVKWLKFSSDINFSTNKSDQVQQFQGTSVIDGLYELPRDISVVDLKDLSSAFNTPEAYFTPYGITNPYWSLANNYFHTDGKQIFGKVQVDAKPIPQLTLTYRFGFNYVDYDAKQGSPQIDLDDALINEDYGYAPSNMNQTGYVYNTYRRRYELNHDFLVNYSDRFVDNRLSLDVNVGLNMNERYSTSMSGEADNLTFETGFWQFSNGAEYTTLSESQSKRRLVGVFGDVTIGWADMIFLNVTARNDWSSTLPINNNSFFYPGVTASWVFSELFKNKKSAFSFGKLRVAYGMTGNDADEYQTQATYSQASASGVYVGTASFPMNGVNAFLQQTSLASESLKPEMTSEFEVGFNIQFFGGRLGLDAAYYNRNTRDQIFSLPVDPATGYSSMVTNFGTVRNTGYELLLNTTPVRTRNFVWNLDINFSQNFNKIMSMPDGLEDGRVSIGSFSAGNASVYAYSELGKAMGEFYTYLPKRTEDGRLIVDSNGYPVMGTTLEDTGRNMNNKWTGGFSTSFNFCKYFTLSAAFDARFGGYMFSRTAELMEFTGNGTVTLYNDRRPFVIPNSVVDNGDGTYSENTTPIYMTNDSFQSYFQDYGFGEGGNSYLIDRSYLKLRNLSFTWDLPKKWMKSMTFTGISLTVFCNNVFTWTAKDNYYVDPEASNRSGDIGAQFGETYSNPSCRIWGMNVNIVF